MGNLSALGSADAGSIKLTSAGSPVAAFEMVTWSVLFLGMRTASAHGLQHIEHIFNRAASCGSRPCLDVHSCPVRDCRNFRFYVVRQMPRVCRLLKP